MPASAVQERYSNVAITLHWLIALGVIANIALSVRQSVVNLVGKIP